MFAIIVTEKGGDQRRLEFDKSEVTIGRVQGNDVILPKGNVSKRHARIVLKDGKFIIVDLKSTNGTYVNGRKITSPLVVKDQDKIYIGDFILGVDGAARVGMGDAGGFPPGPEPMDDSSPPGPEPMANAPLGPPPAPPTRPAPPPARPSPAPVGPPPPVQEPLMGAPPSAGPPPMGPPPMGPPPMGPPPMGPPPMGPPPMGPPPMGPPPMGPPPMGPPSMGPPPPMGPPPMGPPSMAPPVAPPPMGPPPMAAPPIGRPAPGPSSIPAPPPMGPTGPSGTGMGLPPPPSAAQEGPSRMVGVGANAPRIPNVGAPLPTPSGQAQTSPVAAPEPPAVEKRAQPAASPAPVPASRPSGPRPVSVISGRGIKIEPLSQETMRTLDVQRSLIERLVPRLDLENVPVERLSEESLWQKAESAVVDLVETLESSGELPDSVDQDSLIKETLNEALGLGPLEDLLADEEIDEIVVDRRDRILVSRGGVLSGTGKAFSSDDTFRRVVDRLVAPTGHVLNESSPLIDVRLRDGSRLAAAVPPVAVRGACLTLRKPKGAVHTLADLIDGNVMSRDMAVFLTTCVEARRNIVICGAPGAGKSSVLGALAGCIPDGERVVSVEEVAELSLDRDDWIALEARPSDGNGMTEVSMTTLIRSALRMRPDRLVVGDIRGAEALELLSAMTFACDGALLAVAGDSPQIALNRLTAIARLASPGVSIEQLRDIVACAVDIVVHVVRYADGATRIASVAEVVGPKVDGFEVQELFSFRGGLGAEGFTATGVIPSFYSDLEARGMPADNSIFRG